MNVVLLASIREGLKALVINPLRTGLSTLGVVMGIASVVATLSLSDGLEAYTRAQIASHTDVQSVSVNSRTQIERDGFRFPNERFYRFSVRDAADLQAFLGRTDEVTMGVSGQAVVRTATAAPHATLVEATLANFLTYGLRDVFAGRYFSEVEVAHNAPVTILSYPLARDLSPNSDATSMVGQEVRLRTRAMTVVGVMPAYVGETQYEMFVPLRAAPMAIGRADDITPSVYIRSATVETVPMTEQRVIDWLATRMRDWDRQVVVTTSLEQLRQIRTALVVLKLVMVAFASIALAAGGVGIMNVMLASVMERTREIGVRKAMGARHRDILCQFLSESIAVASAGSTLGTITGFSVAFAASAVVRWRVPGAALAAEITPPTLLIAVGAAVSVGIIFGILPALRAARMSPIEAIRHE